MKRPRVIYALAIALWLLCCDGCAMLPIDGGVTVSSKPQFTIQGCILGAEPIVIGQAEPELAAYGIARGFLLMGARSGAAYGPGAIS